MKCLRCGYCCKYSWVMVVDDPEKGITNDNIIEHNGQGQPCQHLRGNKPGNFSCAIHNKPWYKKTPCFSHGQVEQNPDDECRMGRYIMNNMLIVKENIIATAL